MRAEFPQKIIALVIDVHEKKVPQAFDSARTKMAKMARVDFQGTVRMLMQDMENLPPMTEEELLARELMQRNMLDRSALHRPSA